MMRKLFLASALLLGLAGCETYAGGYDDPGARQARGYAAKPYDSHRYEIWHYNNDGHHYGSRPHEIWHYNNDSQHRHDQSCEQDVDVDDDEQDAHDEQDADVDPAATDAALAR